LYEEKFAKKGSRARQTSLYQRLERRSKKNQKTTFSERRSEATPALQKGGKKSASRAMGGKDYLPCGSGQLKKKAGS